MTKFLPLSLALFLSSCGQKDKLAEPSSAHSSTAIELIRNNIDKENQTVTSTLKANKGFFVVGIETAPLAKGLIPTLSINSNDISFEQVNFTNSYTSTQDQYTLTSTLRFYMKGKLVKSVVGSRTMSKIDLTLWDSPKESLLDGIHSVQYGLLEAEGLKFIPTLYYASSLEELKNNVTISASVPLWDWDSATEILIPDKQP